MKRALWLLFLVPACLWGQGQNLGNITVNNIKINGQCSGNCTTASSAGVTSFKGRTGVVTPAALDYLFNQLGGNIATSQMNSGTAANPSTFWRGDGTWQTPSTNALGATMQNSPPIGTIAGTGTVPHNIYTFTLPGGTLSATGGFRVTCSLTIQLAAGHSAACMILGIYGGPSNIDICESPPVNGHSWSFDGWWEFWNNGATNVNYNLGSITANDLSAVPIVSFIENSNTQADTINTAVNQNFFCATQDSTGDTIVTGRMRVERLAP